METNKEVKLQRLQNTAGTAVSENTYNVTIGLTLLWGIAINVLMALFLTPVISQIDIRILIVVYLVGSLGSSYIVYKAKSAAVSFIAYTGLSISMGMLLVPFLAMYSPTAIYSAFLATGIIVVSMMLISMFFPGFFLSLGRVLFFALIGSLLVQIVGGLIFHVSLGILDYVLVVIFAGYVGYDWAKAQAYPRTMNNAVASAADIYVDVINIFIRILSIMGKNKN